MQLAHRLFATRGGTFALAALTAILAAGAILVYLARYRSSLNEQARPAAVLIAKSVIEKGTPGGVVGSQELFQAAELPKGELKEGAIEDPALLGNRMAAHDIYPGQQLTLADFVLASAGALTPKLAADQRAISVPVDGTRAMLGQIQAGDHVDVLVGANLETGGMARPVVKPLLRDVVVLDAPPVAEAGLGGGEAQGQVTLRVTTEQSTQVAFAADNGKVWLVLRPPTGASQAGPDIATAETVLLGVKPIAVYGKLGGRR